jgi:nucleoid-associated protein YgaU
MSSRNENRFTFRNRLKIYREQLESRNVRFIDHFPTPNMLYPNMKQKAALQRTKHIWKVGDRYFKLAQEHYGRSELWWIIAWYNKKPTEAHLKLGDVVYIPKPLEDVYSYLRYL